MEQLRHAELLHPKVSLWALDEHRLGLKPILRPIWAPTGQPLTATVHPRYEWLYIYAFVNPEYGESRFYLVPVLNKDAYQAVMAAFAQSVGAGPEHHVNVVHQGYGACCREWSSKLFLFDCSWRVTIRLNQLI